MQPPSEPTRLGPRADTTGDKPMHTPTSGTRRALTVWGLAALLALSAPAWAQVRIGQPSGFTGSVAAGVKDNTEGAKLYLDAVNARGGVNGQKIELISVDDKFD